MNRYWRRALLLLPLPFAVLPLLAVLLVSGPSSTPAATKVPDTVVYHMTPIAGINPALLVRTGPDVFRWRIDG